jgi:hypothetical protein
MLTVTQLLHYAQPDVVQRSKKTMLPEFKISPMHDQTGPHALINAVAICQPPHGTGNAHRLTLKIYGPWGPQARAWISCDCEWHLFACEVALTIKGNSSIIYSNKMLPVIKNPTFEPWCCKHSIIAMVKALKLKLSVKLSRRRRSFLLFRLPLRRSSLSPTSP